MEGTYVRRGDSASADPTGLWMTVVAWIVRVPARSCPRRGAVGYVTALRARSGPVRPLAGYRCHVPDRTAGVRADHGSEDRRTEPGAGATGDTTAGRPSVEGSASVPGGRSGYLGDLSGEPGSGDPDPKPGDPDPDPDDLDGFQTTMSRVFGRLRLTLGLLVTLAMLIPAGGWMLDRLIFSSAGDAVEEALGDEAAIADALLLVRSVDCLGRSRTGSAFSVEVDGVATVLTNRHVVEGARSTVVQPLDSAQGVQVTAVYEARSADVAVLEVEDAAVPPALPSGAPAELGQSVRTVGFPGSRPAFRQGRIDRVEPARLLLALEVGAGASGSPVLDDEGAVVGQVYARTADGRGVATPWQRVVDAVGDAEPAPACP